MKNKIVAILVVTVVLFMGSCEGVPENFSYMARLNAAILEEYNITDVKIKMTEEAALVVSLSDSKFYDYSPSKKQEIAREIGKLAIDLKEGDIEFDTGTVEFLKNRDFIIVKHSITDSYSMFEGK